MTDFVLVCLRYTEYDSDTRFSDSSVKRWEFPDQTYLEILFGFVVVFLELVLERSGLEGKAVDFVISFRRDLT
jgi:hypothetical protein